MSEDDDNFGIANETINNIHQTKSIIVNTRGENSISHIAQDSTHSVHIDSLASSFLEGRLKLNGHA